MSLENADTEPPRRGSPRLKPELVEKIERELKNWSLPKITWDRVVSRVEVVARRRFSRQALEANDIIHRAYAEAKQKLRKGMPLARRPPMPERLARLQSENERLRQENEIHLEMFVTWLYNAQSYGLRVENLEAELLPAGPDRSDIKERVLQARERQRQKRLQYQQQRLERRSNSSKASSHR